MLLILASISLFLCVIISSTDVDQQEIELDPRLEELVDKNKPLFRAIEIDGDADNELEVDMDDREDIEVTVIFENLSGEDAELWWYEKSEDKSKKKEKASQGIFGNNTELTMTTYVGHYFYFAPPEAKGDKRQKIYEVRIDELTERVTLYDEKGMKEHGLVTEPEKRAFLRDYYNRTGRTWNNYYPRTPVEHFMYNFTHIGQRITAHSTHGHFKRCEQRVIDEVFDKVQQCKQNEQSLSDIGSVADESNDNKTEGENGGTEDGDDDDEDVDDGMPSVVDVPQSHRVETDEYEVIYFNDTYFCREKQSKNMSVSIKVLCTSPKVAYFDGFLSKEETEHIIDIGTLLGLRRSTVTDEGIVIKDRTSSTVWVERHHSPLIDEIVRRVGDIMHIDEKKLHLNESAESLQLVHYKSGQLYKRHLDYGTDRPHNRYITFLMYLNNVGGGGNTSFPRAPKECRDQNGYFGVEPKQGSVAFFYDLLRDGNADELTEHYGEPPKKGFEKWMVNLWIWDKKFAA